MIRGGVPESIAMTVSGHKTRSMLDRYDITDQKDKRLALELAQEWTEAQAGEKSNVVEMSRCFGGAARGAVRLCGIHRQPP
jgi:hypothetical protein